MMASVALRLDPDAASEVMRGIRRHTDYEIHSKDFDGDPDLHLNQKFRKHAIKSNAIHSKNTSVSSVNQVPLQQQRSQISPPGFVQKPALKSFMSPNIRPKTSSKGMSNSKLKSHRNTPVPFAKLDFEPGRSNKLYYNASQMMPITFDMWLENDSEDCRGKFHGYMGEFAHVHDVIISQRQCHGHQGGEPLSQVVNQSEKAEYITFSYGCLQLKCGENVDYIFNGANHLNDWLTNTQFNNVKENKAKDVREEFTIAVTRYEYVNMYHTMTDWYNSFLMMNFFNKTQEETNILIVDAHPQGALDPVWMALFNSTTRLSALGSKTRFTDMVWSIIGYDSPLADHLQMSIPLVEEFREFFLSSYKIDDTRTLNCDRLSILFLWRHDYVAHPRNPTGAISRKIKNEKALLQAAKSVYPQHDIHGLQLDLFDMRKQLQLIAQTDILIGMHGAGLTHALFLPKHSGVIEFIPEYWSAANEHFLAIADWRKLVYQRWTNLDSHNEFPGHYTHIPIEVEQLLLQSVIEKMCEQPETTTASPVVSERETD